MRITAYTQRFVFNIRYPTNRKYGLLTTIELKDARTFWIKRVQEFEFGAEIRSCTYDTPLPRSSKLLRLRPYLDNDGFLCVGGCLNASNLPTSTRNPVVLPENHNLTTLLIADSHANMLHAGVQLTLARLRTKYWLIGGRRPIAHYIRKCVTCCRQRGATQQQVMGDLPEKRVCPGRPFSCSGVDYAGPLNLRI